MPKKLTALTEILNPEPADIALLTTNPGGTPLDRKVALSNVYKAIYKTATEKTVAAGVLTVDQNSHKIQPESGTADDIDTISGMKANTSLILWASDKGVDTLTFKHGTGNLSCFGAADVALSHGLVFCHYDGTTVYVAGGGGGGIGLDKSGWIAATNTWNYVSATSFNIIGVDVTAQFPKGAKIRVNQTGLKYFYVTNAQFTGGNTVVTVNGGSDFSLANAAINSPSYSNVENPFGFPQWFNYVPTLTGFSADPASAVYRFSMQGRTVLVNIYQPNNGTSNATTFTITAPVSPALAGAGTVWTSFGRGVDNNVSLNTPLLLTIASGSGTINLFTNSASAAWTGTGNKRCTGGFISYEF